MAMRQPKDVHLQLRDETNFKRAKGHKHHVVLLNVHEKAGSHLKIAWNWGMTFTWQKTRLNLNMILSSPSVSSFFVEDADMEKS